MTILAVGIDVAKNGFVVHGINDADKAELVGPSAPRAKFHALIAALPPCEIGIEACSGAHCGVRRFAAHGHTVKLMAPTLVTPYRNERQAQQQRRRGSQCDAVQRTMRFVLIKWRGQGATMKVRGIGRFRSR